jgi:Haemolysin-III related
MLLRGPRTLSIGPSSLHELLIFSITYPHIHRYVPISSHKRRSLVSPACPAPTFPSLSSYLIGLFFYFTHFPERYLSGRYMWLDWLGGGSHAIWHGFVVLAISQHRNAMGALKQGVEGLVVDGRCVL